MIRFWVRGTGTLLVLAVLLSACAPAASPAPTPAVPMSAPTKAPQAANPSPVTTTAPAATPTPKPATLVFGNNQTLSNAGIFVAIDKGYFQEQGITLKVENFQSADQLIAPLGTGQLDVSSNAVSVALLAAADRGIEMRAVAGLNQYRPKWESGWVMLRKDLADSGQLKTPADLKGMKVAVSSKGGLGDQVVQTMIEQAKLKPEDVDVVVLPLAEQVAAFGNKAIAASWATEPYIVQGVQQGFSVKWIPTSQFFGGNAQGLFVIFGASLLKDQDLARRWMVAYLKGARDYLKAFTTKEGRDDVIKTLVKYTTLKDPKLYDVMEMPYIDPDGMPDKNSVDAEFKWLVGKGLYAGKKTFADMTDLSSVDYAVQKLGKP